MSALGDPFSMLAFASNGRDDVEMTTVKAFDEPYDRACVGRLAALTSGLSTRLGTALRHAGELISHARKLPQTRHRPDRWRAVRRRRRRSAGSGRGRAPRRGGIAGARHRRLRRGAGIERHEFGGAYLRTRQYHAGAARRGFAGQAVRALFPAGSTLVSAARR